MQLNKMPLKLGPEPQVTSQRSRGRGAPVLRDGPVRARVAIHCGGDTLRGYFVPVPARAAMRAPVVVCVRGEDQRKVDLMRSLPAHAQACGLSLLIVDLPGQGVGAARGRSVGRYDIETAISGWVDYLTKRRDVAPAAIALFGNGPGAALATRGAAFDDRFAAVVCDGGIRDLLERASAAHHFSGGGEQPRGSRDFGASSIARTINCPVLVTREAHDLSEPDLVEWCGSGLRAAGLDIAWRIFGEGDEGEADAPVAGSAAVNAFAFGWIADRLGQAWR